jgi:HSP20 family protein
MTEREPPPSPSFFGRFPAGPVRGPWRPPADVYRTRDGWLVKLELAGVRPDELEIQVSGTKLRVAGVRRDFVIREAEHAHSMEISYNRFERAIEFPERLDRYATETRYQDGMLLVFLRRNGGG